MAISWIRWIISRIAIAIAIVVVVAAWALLWAISWLWSLLAPQWDSRTIIAVVIVGLVPLAAIWWLWWRLPRRQVARLSIQIPDPKARADAEDNFRKTVGQALGGAAVLIGAGVAYLQFSQQQQASRDLLISNQVSKGFEQLGSNERVVRLGGIYALEGVMNTSVQYHQPALEALCAFVRDMTKIGTFEAPPATDIQAALTVITRRVDGQGQVDLTNAKIPKAKLGIGSITADPLDLANARLSGVDLSGADIQSVNLSHADLRRANLTGAYLRWVDLSFADLDGADMRNIKLVEVLLPNAGLGNTNLTGADLRQVPSFLLTQKQLDEACGTDVKLPKGLTLDKPCPAVAPPLNRRTTP